MAFLYQFPFLSFSPSRLLDRIDTVSQYELQNGYRKREREGEREWGRIRGALFIINDIHVRELVNSRDFHSVR